MGAAFGWGALASSSLVLGALLTWAFGIGQRLLGLIMAFGAGVLISAVSFELVGEAHETSAGSGGVGLGLLCGCAVFFVGDALIDRMGGAERKDSGGGQAEGSPLAITLGIVLDGIPESIVLGLTILQGGTVSTAFLVAVLLSNVPESIAATAGLTRAGWGRARIIGLWTLVTVVCGLSSLFGYAVFDAAAPSTVAFVMSFAAGAILTMLADTMMPEAFEHGGKLVGVLTTLGFALAYGIHWLE
jgi:zinc transporter, ZIP family